MRTLTACAPLGHLDLDALDCLAKPGARFAQLLERGIERVGGNAREPHAAAGGGRGGEIGAGLDAIGHHRCAAAPSELDALDAHHIGPRALDARAHGDQALREVDHLGLARRVLDQRRALGERRRHHQVLRSGHRDEIHDDARAAQALRLRVHVAALDANARAHRLQAFHMLVDRPQADGAAAGQRDPGPAAARKQRAEHQHRGAHGLHEVVGRRGIGDCLPRRAASNRRRAPRAHPCGPEASPWWRRP